MNIVTFFLFFFVSSVSCANILVLLPFQSRSHYFVFEPLVEELAKRGHHVSFVCFPPNDKTNSNLNYTLISLANEVVKPPRSLQTYDKHPSDIITNLNLVYTVVTSYYDNIYSLPQIKKLLDNKYDLVIAEYFNSEAFFGLVHKIGAPMILLSTCDYFVIHNYAMSNDINPAYIHVVLSTAKLKVNNLIDRTWNTISLLLSIAAHRIFYLPQAQQLAEKHVGSLPDLWEIAKNASLIMANSHFSIHGTKSTATNSIEIGGINVKDAKPLPKDLEKTIQDSKSGVIYFSMGSVIKGSTMAETKAAAFTKVFSELPETVLWKREDGFKGPKNVITSSWFPQRDILAHPNVKLFISHCGLLGINEAIASGVPIVCIPMFGDQHHNARALETQGAAVYLEFTELNEINIRNAVKEVLQNPTYKENAVRVQQAFLDRPMTPLDTAVYWVEYVIRHKGANHLKSPARLLTWYEYHNIDVMLIIISVVVLFLLMLKKFLCLIYRILKFLCCKANSKTKTKIN